MKKTMHEFLTENQIEPVLISQRLKRLTSIEYQLDLNKTMALGNMQDIGGFRIVVKDIKDLVKLRNIIEGDIQTSRY